MLQWGRNYRCGNGSPILGCTLQWGRNCCFNGAATLSLRKLRLLHGSIVAIHASMGPQLYRCGNVQNQALPKRNMGASMGPQLYRCGNILNVARNPVQSLPDITNAPTASMGPQLYRCGNSEGGLQCESRRAVGQLASMGPQLYRCGNNGKLRVARSARLSYTPVPASMGLVAETVFFTVLSKSTRVSNLRCFNGAATLSLRKLSSLSMRHQAPVVPHLSWGPCPEGSHPYKDLLQWGRNFIVAETWYKWTKRF